MDAETRKTLEALHDAAMTSIPAMNAIRAALAEIDALRSQVADLTATLDGAVDLRKSIEREREEARYQVDALTQQVQDLEARAIPKRWVDNARTLTLEIEHHDFTGRRIQYFKPRGAELCSVTDVGDHHEPIDFPTLSAALSAAKEAP